MGRASRRRRTLRDQRRAFTLDRIRLVLETLDADPCATCAFLDPEAWIADCEIPWKLEDALTRNQPFYCHRDLPVDTEGGYLLPRRPDGTILREKLHLCVPYARLLRRLAREPGAQPPAGIIRAVRRKLLERYAGEIGGDEHSRGLFTDQGNNVDAIEWALDRLAAERRGDVPRLCHISEDGS